jgi:DNA-directed RNA polymerase sigma subunit (sigma70/sigma32)
VINSLIDKKSFKDNSFESLLTAICVPEQNKAKIDKKAFSKFAKFVLTDLEVKIIIARYGLGTAKPKSLLDLSKDLSMTREKIRQITEKAIFKLRMAVLDEETEKEIYNIK